MPPAVAVISRATLRTALILAAVMLAVYLAGYALFACTAAQNQAATAANAVFVDACATVALANGDKLAASPEQVITKVCQAERFTRRLRSLILAAQAEELARVQATERESAESADAQAPPSQ